MQTGKSRKKAAGWGEERERAYFFYNVLIRTLQVILILQLPENRTS